MDNKIQKFRSLQEVKKYLQEISEQVRQDEERIDQSVTQLSKVKINALEIMDISGDENAKKPGAKRAKKTMNVDFPMVKIPNKKALEHDYKLAEELSERYKSLIENENQVRLSFKDSKGAQFQELMASFHKLKTTIEAHLRKLFTALSNIAEGHAPKEFKDFMKGLAEELESHLEYDDAKTAIYASVDKESNLVFAAYLILTNAVSDEGKIAPHLYIIVKWTVSSNVEIFIEHEFIAPSILEGGSVVENLHQAAKAVKYQLDLEGFSSQIGTLPISMQLRTPASGLSKELFSPKDWLKSVTAEENELIFVLKPGIESKAMQQIQSQLFQEVKAMIKNKRQAKIRMRAEGNELHFFIVGVEHSGVAPHDVEFLKDKYGLSEPQLRKIVNVING